MKKKERNSELNFNKIKIYKMQMQCIRLLADNGKLNRNHRFLINVVMQPQFHL